MAECLRSLESLPRRPAPSLALGCPRVPTQGSTATDGERGRPPARRRWLRRAATLSLDCFFVLENSHFS